MRWRPKVTVKRDWRHEAGATYDNKVMVARKDRKGESIASTSITSLSKSYYKLLSPLYCGGTPCGSDRRAFSGCSYTGRNYQKVSSQYFARSD